MTPGLRTSAGASADITAILPAIAIAPATDALSAPWRQLLTLALSTSAAGLRRQDVYNARDQSILALTLRLLHAGRNACWRIANLYSETPGVTMCNWQIIAVWHHNALVAIHAGWQRRLPVGINRDLPIEANMITPEPLAVRVTDTADRWLTLLARDPLDLSASEARLGLTTIPAGVWISP